MLLPSNGTKFRRFWVSNWNSSSHLAASDQTACTSLEQHASKGLNSILSTNNQTHTFAGDGESRTEKSAEDVFHFDLKKKRKSKQENKTDADQQMKKAYERC